ncbi:hypothetical protein ACTHOQ_16190 [Solibacillus silvestris]|uniref:hypothetical protein n=1 Tax=Solibacillus silvestris TaxID=76853 RepID=UPI003F80789F
MKFLKNLLWGIFAAAYFIIPMGVVILLLVFTPLMFQSDVNAIRASGFAGPDRSITFISMAGMIIGISLLVPALRKVYGIFPWLFPFVKIFFVTFVILNVGIAILNYGYEVNNPKRHTLFYILMIVFVFSGRLVLSYYFWRKPVNIGKEEGHFHEG